MDAIAIMLLLAFFTAGGVFLTMAACFTGQTVWPLASVMLSVMALLPLCTCGLDANNMDMPSVLQDADDKRLGAVEVGWMLCGVFLTGAWSCPLILARHGVLSMRISWLTSLGTWSLIGTIALGITLLLKGQNAHGSDFAY